MKKRSHTSGPKQLKAFFDNYKAAVILAMVLFFSLFAKSQTIDTARTRQNILANPGYWYISLEAYKGLVPPRDTVRLAQKDSGAIAYKNGRFWQYTGAYWDTLRGAIGGGSGGGVVNLSKSYTTSSVTITPSGGGTYVSLDPVSNTQAGIVTTAQKASWDSAWTLRVVKNDSVTWYYNTLGVPVWKDTAFSTSFARPLYAVNSYTVGVKNDSAAWNAKALQGIAVSNTAPTTSQVLTYNGTAWAPAAGGGGGGLSGLTTNRVPYVTSPTSISDDAGLTYDAATNYLTSDTFSILKQHFRTRNGLFSIRHNFQADSNFAASGSFPTSYFGSGSDGSFRDIDGQFDNVEYRGYNILTPGNRINTNEAAFWHQEESHFIAGGTSQFEIHDDFINKAGTNNYRWFGIDIKKVAGTGNGYWRADSWNWFQSGSTLRPMLTLSPAKLEYDLINSSSYFSITKTTNGDYLRITIDSINNVIPITHTKPIQFGSAVNIGGAFTTTATVGTTPVEFGNLTLKSASSAQLHFAPGNSISYRMGQTWNSAGYGVIGINAPNGLGRGLTSNEGVEFLLDARGVAAPLRIGTITTGGTETFTSFGADGRIAIGQSIQSPPVGLYINYADAIRIPVGNTAARPGSPAVGYMRFNTDSGRVEVYTGTIWRAFLYNGESVGGGGSFTLNTLTASTQTFAPGTAGTDFGIVSAGSTHTFNIPDAGSGSRGLVNTGAQGFQGVKTFTNKPLGGGTVTGQSFEVGTFGISNSGAASLRFGPSNADNKSGWSVNTDYMSLGINAANTFGNDAARNGAEILFDTRSGVADPIRFFVNKIGASAQALAINDDAEIKIGSSTTQAGYKLQVTGGLYQQGAFRLGGTKTAVSPSFLLVKTSDSLVSEIAFPGGTSTFLAADGTFQTPAGGGLSGLSVNAIQKATSSTTLGPSLLNDDGVNTTFSGGMALSSTQTVTSGTSSTIGNGVYRYEFDPASVISTYTLTMPAAPADGQQLIIRTGKVIAAGSPTITSLTISPNSGQSIFGAITVTSLTSGDTIVFEYETSSTTWYRIR